MKHSFLCLIFMAVVSPLLAQSDTVITKPDMSDTIMYTCPMHPEIVSDQPGKCPTCGMDLVQKKSVSSEHKMNMMMMSPMHGMAMNHEPDKQKKNQKKMMRGLGIGMGAMMVVMMVILLGRR